MIKDASHYMILSNVPGKEQDGINLTLLAFWSNIENWYGDPHKKETGRDFLLRMQSLYNIQLKTEDTGSLLANAFIGSQERETIFALTNLDAEDLGSSILRTYNTHDEAYDDMALIESGEHPDFFNSGVIDIFEIKLPSYNPTQIQKSNPK